MPELSQHFGALGSNCCAYAVHGQSRTSARDVCVCVSTSEKCEGRMMVHAHRVHILHKYVNIHVLGLRTLNKERERVPPFQDFSVITALSVLLSAQWSGPVNPREDFSMIFYV